MSTAERPSPAALQTAFDNSIWYLLTLWPPMALALANSFGGPLTADKRDWLAGAVSSLFDERADLDAYDVEDVLVQAMGDEFDLAVEDESEVAVAAEIVALRRSVVVEGSMEGAERVRARWEARKGMKVEFMNGGERVEEVDEEDAGSDEEMEDVEMGEAPQLVDRREREAPEVDEDGFTKVVARKKR